MDLVKLCKRLEKATYDNSPTILTGIGVATMLTTAYLTHRAASKATVLILEEERTEGRTLRYREVFDLTWRLYIPPVSTAILSGTAIICANNVSSRRATAVATAYSISERAFADYKEKVVEKLGEKKEQAIHDEIAQDRVRNNPPNDSTVVITDGGEVLCHDSFSGRYFKSSMETIQRAENEINHQILNEGYASLSELYYLLGLPPTGISEEVGWSQLNKLLSITYSTVLSPDNKPCISISFDTGPSRNFSRFSD